MEKTALRFLILTVLFQVALCAFIGLNVYVDQKRTWSEARQHYNDEDKGKEKDNDKAQQEDKGLFDTWVGLYKNTDDTWKWSGGKNVSLYYWPKLPHKKKTCLAINATHLKAKKCETTKFPFWCFQSHLVLVKENKTWEEAMEHCHHLDKELLSLPSETALVQALQTSRIAQTDRVWIGLRYLAHTWLWMDGSTVEDMAWSQGATPQCPAWSHHCGALSPGSTNCHVFHCNNLNKTKYIHLL
uniref:C-type lectin domain-containing protein n=1 Tax=Stegastes partitus TaxID=144197 RepID=A0A3B4ZG40_9TELE